MRTLSGVTTTTVMLLGAAAFAVALPGCTSDQPEAGLGNVDMAVTLATPPSGPNEQIDAVNVSLWCEDPFLPAQEYLQALYGPASLKAISLYLESFPLLKEQ